MPSPLSAPAGASVPQTILTTTQLASFVSPTISAPRTIAPYGWGNRSVSHGTSPSAGLMPNAAMIGNRMFVFTPAAIPGTVKTSALTTRQITRAEILVRQAATVVRLVARSKRLSPQPSPAQRQIESADVRTVGVSTREQHRHRQQQRKPQGMRRRRRLDRMEASWESFIVLMVKRRALYVADAWHLFLLNLPWPASFDCSPSLSRRLTADFPQHRCRELFQTRTRRSCCPCCSAASADSNPPVGM